MKTLSRVLLAGLVVLMLFGVPAFASAAEQSGNGRARVYCPYYYVWVASIDSPQPRPFNLFLSVLLSAFSNLSAREPNLSRSFQKNGQPTGSNLPTERFGEMDQGTIEGGPSVVTVRGVGPGN